jgi:dUTPase
MPTLISNPELIAAIGPGGFIVNGKSENIDGVKYDFSLSPNILKSKFGQPIDISQLPETRKVDLYVEPGEVVFVLTEEKVKLPDDVMALLIPKRKLSHDGIMLLGGLSIDPLYEGRLLIGLYNLSSSPFPIIAGRKLIGAKFFKLSADEKKGITKPDVRIDEFPDDLIRLMKNYRPVSNETLLNDVKNLETKFESLIQEIRDKDDWFEKFQRSLSEQEKNIDKILKGLEGEVKDRRESDKELDSKIQGFHTEIKEYSKSAYKTAAWIGTLGALVISLLMWLIQTFLVPKDHGNERIQPINIHIDSTFNKSSR